MHCNAQTAHERCRLFITNSDSLSAVRSELEPVPVFCNGVQLYTALPFASIATFCQLGQNRVEAFFGADEDERQADKSHISLGILIAHQLL